MPSVELVAMAGQVDTRRAADSNKKTGPAIPCASSHFALASYSRFGGLCSLGAGMLAAGPVANLLYLGEKTNQFRWFLLQRPNVLSGPRNTFGLSAFGLSGFHSFSMQAQRPGDRRRLPCRQPPLGLGGLSGDRLRLDFYQRSACDLGHPAPANLAARALPATLAAADLTKRCRGSRPPRPPPRRRA